MKDKKYIIPILLWVFVIGLTIFNMTYSLITGVSVLKYILMSINAIMSIVGFIILSIFEYIKSKK